MNTYRIILKPAIFLFYILSLCLPSFNLYGQKFTFRNYDIIQGLSQSAIHDIHQDSKGYLWFATEAGVCKFDGKTFQNITTEHGLVNNIVQTITEDRYGNLWFGTVGGVSKFDGKYFQNFNSKNGLTNEAIMSILEDKKGNIWFGTFGGGIVKLVCENSSLGKKSDTTLITYTTEQGLANNFVYTMLEDNNGNLWIGTYGGGISKLILDNDNETEMNFQNFTTENGLGSNRVVSIWEDKNGDLWFGAMGGGLSKIILNGKEDTLTTFENFTIQHGIPDNNVLSIQGDQNGDLWLGTGGGVSRLVLSDSKGFPSFENFTTHQGLIDNVIWTMLEDKNGNLWFGSHNKGISKFQGKIFEIYSTNEGLNNDQIWAVIEDIRSDLWVGSYGGGVYKLIISESELNNIVVEHFTEDLGLIDNYIHTIFEDHNEYIWFGTKNGVTKLITPALTITDNDVKLQNITTQQGLINNEVHAIAEDSYGNIWFGTKGGISILTPINNNGYNFSMQSFTIEDGLINNIVNSILEDNNGNIWIGTYGGISKVSGYEYKDTTIAFTNYTIKEGLANNIVFSILEDTKGNLWFATEGGLSKLVLPASPRNSGGSDSEGSPSYFQNFTTKDGLKSIGYWLSCFDNEGNLWISHTKGIEKLVLSESEGTTMINYIRHYGYLEGFTPLETNANAVYKDRKGNMWFGTSKGLVKYNPKEDRINMVEPRTHITNLHLFGKKTDFTTWCDSVNLKTNLPVNLKLPYDKNNITFVYIGIHFKIPEKVQYQYMLEGLDRDWSEVTTETFTKYTNLDPGKYTFKVKAGNSDGIWNQKPTEFSFVIIPPFWQTWWYYTSEISFCFTLIAISFFVNKSRTKSRVSSAFSLIAIILIFEFINISIEPYIEGFAGEVPLIKLVLNVSLALSLNPLENLISHLDKYF